MIRLSSAAIVSLLPLHAMAQSSDGGFGLAFSLGAGAASVPGYFGSDEAEAGPDLAFDFGAIRLGRISFGEPGREANSEGLDFQGSFRFIGGRSSDDFDELRGLEDVNASLEIGGGLSYARPWWEAFAVARYGVIGHESLVGEVGMDLIARPMDRLTLRAGPRVTFGADEFASTYFSVTSDEATTSDYAAYEASGGIMTSGIEIGAAYEVSEKWDLEADVRFDRLQNDAADSPITIEDDQVSASLSLTRRFTIGF